MNTQTLILEESTFARKRSLFYLIFLCTYYTIVPQININEFTENTNMKYLDDDGLFFKSRKIDFLQIESSITEGVKFAIAIYKPEKPSPILLTTHGWHGNVNKPDINTKNPFNGFLTIDVDMRGRKYSIGKQDCNGYELYDVYDAYHYLLKNYSHLISDSNQVYFRGESGGGGNGYGLLGKFPDLFCSAMITCGPSDYELWFRDDAVGEFKDEMIPWIGSTPDENKYAYSSRSGITTVSNLLTPVYICHGETDEAVPSEHGRIYYDKAKKMNKYVEYLELENVGNERHWGNITQDQIIQKQRFEETALEKHKVPALPNIGKFIVAGYLITKKFSVFMNSIDDVGIIYYNIPKREVEFIQGSGKIVWTKSELLE